MENGSKKATQLRWQSHATSDRDEARHIEQLEEQRQMWKKKAEIEEDSGGTIQYLYTRRTKIGKKVQFREVVPHCLPHRLNSTCFFKNLFEWSSPEEACGVKKEFQKTLISISL